MDAQRLRTQSGASTATETHSHDPAPAVITKHAGSSGSLFQGRSICRRQGFSLPEQRGPDPDSHTPGGRKSHAAARAAGISRDEGNVRNGRRFYFPRTTRTRAKPPGPRRTRHHRRGAVLFYVCIDLLVLPVCESAITLAAGACRDCSGTCTRRQTHRRPDLSDALVTRDRRSSSPPYQTRAQNLSFTRWDNDYRSCAIVVVLWVSLCSASARITAESAPDGVCPGTKAA